MRQKELFRGALLQINKEVSKTQGEFTSNLGQKTQLIIIFLCFD